jgi:hypothetical protein
MFISRKFSPEYCPSFIYLYAEIVYIWKNPLMNNSLSKAFILIIKAEIRPIITVVHLILQSCNWWIWFLQNFYKFDILFCIHSHANSSPISGIGTNFIGIISKGLLWAKWSDAFALATFDRRRHRRFSSFGGPQGRIDLTTAEFFLAAGAQRAPPPEEDVASQACKADADHTGDCEQNSADGASDEVNVEDWTIGTGLSYRNFMDWTCPPWTVCDPVKNIISEKD